jgi:hypothetical protein
MCFSFECVCVCASVLNVCVYLCVCTLQFRKWCVCVCVCVLYTRGAALCCCCFRLLPLCTFAVAVGVWWFARVCEAVGHDPGESYRAWLSHLAPDLLKVGGVCVCVF